MTYLANLEPVGMTGEARWKSEPVIVDGREYTNGLTADYSSYDCGEAQVEYALSRRYVRFRGIVGFADDTSNTTPIGFKIFLDGTVAQTGVIQLRKPIKIDLPVNGAVRLGLVFDKDTCEPSATVALGDPILESQP